MLDRAHPAGTAVADKASRFVDPLVVEKINGVLERAGDAMVVLRRDEDIAVKRADLSSPHFGVRLTVLAHYGRHRLGKERQGGNIYVPTIEHGGRAVFLDVV